MVGALRVLQLVANGHGCMWMDRWTAVLLSGFISGESRSGDSGDEIERYLNPSPSPISHHHPSTMLINPLIVAATAAARAIGSITGGDWASNRRPNDFRRQHGDPSNVMFTPTTEYLNFDIV